MIIKKASTDEDTSFFSEDFLKTPLEEGALEVIGKLVTLYPRHSVGVVLLLLLAVAVISVIF